MDFEGGREEMAKSARKRAKGTIPAKKAKKPKKTTKVKTRAVESLDCLLELHKLQGVLLAQLAKEI